MRTACVLFCFIVLLGCSNSKRSTQSTIRTAFSASSLKLLDEYHIPHKLLFQHTQIGGLSGIDYNPAKNRYYIISDDRSNATPARFYTADIVIHSGKVDTILFIAADTLRNPKGQPYPAHKDFPQLSPDPESIRFNGKTNSLFWTSEGERQIKNGSDIIQQPFIYEMDLHGYFMDSFLLPEILTMQQGKGPRRNSVFEGFSFANDFKSAFVSCEEPLLQDGPAATVDYAGALTRITKFDTKTKQAIAQYAYPLDAIAHSPKPAGAFAVNGISEILAVDEKDILVMERSFSTGRLINTIKIFLADLTAATNVLNKPSLANVKSFKSASKKLLFNSDSLNRYFDNVEGICFGPILENGNRSLLLIVDDNFNPLEKTQMFLFEIIP